MIANKVDMKTLIVVMFISSTDRWLLCRDEGLKTWLPQLWQGVVLASCGPLLVFITKQASYDQD